MGYDVHVRQFTLVSYVYKTAFVRSLYSFFRPPSAVIISVRQSQVLAAMVTCIGIATQEQQTAIRTDSRLIDGSSESMRKAAQDAMMLVRGLTRLVIASAKDST